MLYDILVLMQVFGAGIYTACGEVYSGSIRPLDVLATQHTTAITD